MLSLTIKSMLALHCITLPVETKYGAETVWIGDPDTYAVKVCQTDLCLISDYEQKLKTLKEKVNKETECLRLSKKFQKELK